LQLLLDNALKANTRRTYSSAQKRFINFCAIYDFDPLPASEEILLYYISFLFSQGLKGSSIRVYLSALRSLHVINGLPYLGNTPRMLMALKGAFVLSEPPCRKQPVTYTLLCKILPLLRVRDDGLLLASAMSLAFFGCLRSGEFCLTDKGDFNPEIHLCVGDVSFDDSRKVLTLLLKASKTDF
jgi:hypothetical protein